MSLREEMCKYEQITGESAEHVPIIKLGAFLDGYEMGLKASEQQTCDEIHGSTYGGVSWSGTYTSKEQQHCEDCISREDAIKAIQNNYEESKADNASIGCLTGLANAAFLIHNLPSIKPQPTFYPPCEDCNTKMDEVRRAYDRCRWIPCSVRLPEDGAYVLGQSRLGGIHIYQKNKEIRATGICGGWWAEGNWYSTNYIVAWMPLPQPYKAESEGEE